VIFRLVPQDYHRFHSPVDGRVGPMTYISGEYYTVNVCFLVFSPSLSLWLMSWHVIHKQKAGQGFNHPVTGALLCLIELDWTDPTGMMTVRGNEDSRGE
jgi:Phosphatidylserine decarboxylase